MRIVIIQDRLRIGGTERHSILTAKDLKRAGHEPVLLLFRPGGELFNEIEDHDFATRILQRFDSGISLWAPRLKNEIKSLQPEVILCMGRTANCYAGYLQTSFPAIPVVATVRTGKHLLPFHTSSLGKAACIIVNSHWWKRELLKKQLSSDKIHVIHNPSLLQAAQFNDSKVGKTVRGKHGAGDTTCVFLNVATFRPGKRHMDLLCAFQKLNEQHPQTDWQLWLAGHGRTLKKCRNWSERNGLSSRVYFLGYQADPAPLYAAADVAVSLSMEDSLPNFLIEAQTQGLPVIARDFRGVEETFKPGKSGILVKTASPGMLVPLIRQMASKPDLRKAYSTVARKSAQSRFNPDHQGKVMIKLLEKLAAEGI